METPEVVEAIHRLELNVTTKLTALESTLDQQGDRLDVLFDKAERNERALYGMGSDNPGLVTKVTLLEESRQKTNVAVAGSYTGVGAWVVKLFNDLFTGS